MENEINEAIKVLVEKSKTAPFYKATYYTQAALNLARMINIRDKIISRRRARRRKLGMLKLEGEDD